MTGIRGLTTALPADDGESLLLSIAVIRLFYGQERRMDEQTESKRLQ